MTRMTIALGPAAVWSGLDHLSIDEARDFVRRVDAAGYDAFWTREGFGREPFSFLAAVAASSDRLTFGTSIANIHARDAAAMRAAAATLMEVTAGRFVLGLGVSHAPWVEGIRGHDYGSPVQVMQGYLEAYGAAPYRVATPFGMPPVLLAALRSRMLRLAGERADGAFPYLVPSTAVAGMRRALDEAAADAGRPTPALVVAQGVLPESDPAVARAAGAAWLKNYLGLPAYLASFRALGFVDEDWTPEPSERLIDAIVSWGPPDRIRERLRSIVDAGADQVAVVPLQRDGVPGSAEAFEAVAPPW